MILSELGACWDGNTFYVTTSFGMTHVILKTITRTRTLKGGGFGLTMSLVTKPLGSSRASSLHKMWPSFRVSTSILRCIWRRRTLPLADVDPK